jgi:hypothetical protein
MYRWTWPEAKNSGSSVRCRGRADRAYARVDVAEADELVVGNPLTQRLDDDAELTERAAEFGQYRVAEGSPTGIQCI